MCETSRNCGSNSRASLCGNHNLFARRVTDTKRPYADWGESSHRSHFKRKSKSSSRTYRPWQLRSGHEQPQQLQQPQQQRHLIAASVVPPRSRAQWGSRQRARLTPFAFQPFCWSHGPCKHLGTGCGDPEAGHKEHATWQNQMGSTWKTYYESRGWSIISP